MSSGFQEVLESAVALPDTERAELIEALIATLGAEAAAPLDDAWLAEIERRSQEFDEGKVSAIPWAQVKVRARGRQLRHE